MNYCVLFVQWFFIPHLTPVHVSPYAQIQQWTSVSSDPLNQFILKIVNMHTVSQTQLSCEYLNHRWKMLFIIRSQMTQISQCRRWKVICILIPTIVRQKPWKQTMTKINWHLTLPKRNQFNRIKLSKSYLFVCMYCLSVTSGRTQFLFDVDRW